MTTVLITWRDSAGSEYADEPVLAAHVARFTADITAAHGTWVSETWAVNGRRVTIAKADGSAYFRLVVVGAHDAHFTTLDQARDAVAAETRSANEADTTPVPDIYTLVEAAGAMAHFIPQGRVEVAIMTADEGHKVECYVSCTPLEGRVQFRQVNAGRYAGKWAVSMA